MHKISIIISIRAIVQEVWWSDRNEDMLPGERRKRRRGRGDKNGERERD
jgi:hypothetical protein